MRRAAAMVIVAAATGCIDTDAAVFVEPTLEAASAELVTGVASSGLGGAFQLRLHLGPRASDASRVALQQASITDSSRTSTLLSALALTTDPPFPVTVNVDSDVLVAASFAASENIVDDAAAASLCAGLVVVVALDDSLRGTGVSVASDAIAPGGCP